MPTLESCREGRREGRQVRSPWPHVPALPQVVVIPIFQMRKVKAQKRTSVAKMDQLVSDKVSI